MRAGVGDITQKSREKMNGQKIKKNGLGDRKSIKVYYALLCKEIKIGKSKHIGVPIFFCRLYIFRAIFTHLYGYFAINSTEFKERIKIDDHFSHFFDVPGAILKRF